MLSVHLKLDCKSQTDIESSLESKLKEATHEVSKDENWRDSFNLAKLSTLRKVFATTLVLKSVRSSSSELEKFKELLTY